MGWHYSTGSTTHTFWRHERETLNISRIIQTWQLQEYNWEKDPDATEVQDFLQEHTNCQVCLTPPGQTLLLSLTATACEEEQCCAWVAWWTARRVDAKECPENQPRHRTGSDLSRISHTTGRNYCMQPDWLYMVHGRHLGIWAFALTSSLSHC